MYRIFDAHCHIYPEAIARKAVEGIDRFYGNLPFRPFDGTTGTLLRIGHDAGITHFVAVPLRKALEPKPIKAAGQRGSRRSFRKPTARRTAPMYALSMPVWAVRPRRSAICGISVKL